MSSLECLQDGFEQLYQLNQRSYASSYLPGHTMVDAWDVPYVLIGLTT